MASLKENIAYTSERLSNSTIKVDELAKNVKVGDTYTFSGFYSVEEIKIESVRETKTRRFFTESVKRTDKQTGAVTESTRTQTGGLGFNSYFFL